MLSQVSKSRPGAPGVNQLLRDEQDCSHHRRIQRLWVAHVDHAGAAGVARAGDDARFEPARRSLKTQHAMRGCWSASNSRARRNECRSRLPRLAESGCNSAVSLSHALVNNAGFAVPGFADDVTDAELRHQFDTNFFGAAAVTRALLPQLRRQRFGHVVMVSSISGRLGYPGVSSYCGLEVCAGGMDRDVAIRDEGAGDSGGAGGTGIVRHRHLDAEREADGRASGSGFSANASRVPGWRRRIEQGAKDRADPQVVADVIARVLETPRPKLRYVVGKDARMALRLRRIFPAGIFERMIVKMTGMD